MAQLAPFDVAGDFLTSIQKSESVPLNPMQALRIQFRAEARNPISPGAVVSADVNDE